MSRKNTLLKIFVMAAAVVCMTGLVSDAAAQRGAQQHQALTPGVPFFATGPGWYQVNVPAAGILTVHTVGNFYDTVGEIYNSAGELVASDDDGGNGTNTRVSSLVSAGTYFVAVGILGGGVGPFVIHTSVSR